METLGLPRKEVIDAFGSWLSLYTWYWFITITFDDSKLPSPGPDRRAGWSFAWKRWRDFLSRCDLHFAWSYRGGYRLQRQAHWYAVQKENYWWWATLEVQRRGAAHIHALIGGPGMERRKSLYAYQWLRRECGYASVRNYNPALGAAYYLEKYLTKDLADWKAVLPSLDTVTPR
jgi:hypothetical protein